MSSLTRDEILILFDIDGTITPPRQSMEAEFQEFFYSKVKPQATIGVVSGSDLEKMFEQLNGKDILSNFDFVFPENGLVQIVKGKEIGKQSLLKHLGDDVIQRFINFCLRYLSELQLPFKRGIFLETRNGMMNVCPVGRQCTREERNLFSEYDKVHNIRANMIEVLKQEFHDIDLTYSIGGQISFDVFPHGWDKSYCLQHVAKYNFKEIHFIGDKTDKGGNDHEIFNDERTIGHKVQSPDDTKRILTELLNL